MIAVQLERLHVGERGRFEQRVASLQLGDVLGVDRDGGREQLAEPVFLWAEIEKAIDQRGDRLLQLGRESE